MILGLRINGVLSFLHIADFLIPHRVVNVIPYVNFTFHGIVIETDEFVDLVCA